jgi:hypothetical protein
MFKLLITGSIATITWYGIWILGLINLAWLLFKDHTLFSWWWVIGSVIAFAVFLVVSLAIIINRK